LKAFSAAALAVVVAVILQIVLPGRAVYHTGLYNVLLIALVVVTIVGGRRAFRGAPLRVRLAIIAMVLGAAITGFAGAANGLLAPDNVTIVGAPGERIRVDDLGGALVFPLAAAMSANAPPVILERPAHAPATIAARSRNIGSFILRTLPRDVIYVEVHDLQGNHLTVTQPAGRAFLSPVLLMEQRQTIAGMDLPFDSFNVPAQRRVVKAVLFSPAQAAMLLHGTAGMGRPAVLFAVDDENDRPLPHAIGLAVGGASVRAGGLLLGATVLTYPTVEIVAAPALFAVALGTMLVLAALAALLAGDHRTNVPQLDAAVGELDTLGREHVDGNQPRSFRVGREANVDVPPSGLIEPRGIE
jgi:hypothetical protein